MNYFMPLWSKLSPTAAEMKKKYENRYNQCEKILFANRLANSLTDDPGQL